MGIFVIGDEERFSLIALKGNPPEFYCDMDDSRTKLTVCVRQLCGEIFILGPYFFERNVNGLDL